MKTILLSTVLLLMSIPAIAQPDTVENVKTTTVEVWDVVAVYREHRDGRGNIRQYTSELKGEILSYDASTGLLTFKDRDGKMYSLKSGDYKYFEYDKEFTVKIKTPRNLERKNTGFEYSVGISGGYIGIQDNFTSDDYFLRGFGSDADFPVCVKVSASKFLNERSLIGLTSEFAVFTDEKLYLNIGARYQFMYNPTRSSAFYFPLELKYSRYKLDLQYQVNDTTFSVSNSESWEYPSRLNTDVNLNSIELCLGQGVSFAMKNKKSLSLELMLLKQFVMSRSFKNAEGMSPNSKFGIIGGKLSVFMNF